MKSIEQLAAIYQNAAHKASTGKAVHITHWDSLDVEIQALVIEGMRAALAALGSTPAVEPVPSVEPLPADKWAAEKAAHAQGKAIEQRTKKEDSGEWGEWLPVSFPMWKTVSWSEYRIAPDPAPAGKLTDEQLGYDASFKALQAHGVTMVSLSKSEPTFELDAKIRTTIARAVREAVEKETPWGANNETKEQWMARWRKKYESVENGLTEQLELEQALKNSALANQAACCEILVKKAEEIARLTAELDERRHVMAMIVRRIGHGLHGLSHTEIEPAVVKIVEELAKANAELERLRWISRDILPARDDADANGYVNCLKRDGNTCMQKIGGDFHESIAFWRPFCPPPAPTAEEVERERFEIWAATSSFGHDLTRTPCGKYYNSVLTCEAWELWQAARASKEGKA